MGPIASAAVLAVDGGGSKTDAVVVDLDGTVVSRARGGASNAQSVGWSTARSTLDQVRARALAGARGRRIVRTHAYLAGLDFPAEHARARDELAHWAEPDAALELDTDVFALLRAGTLSPDAVAVVCGTGINAVGVRADGVTARFAAVGDPSGDWGGGAWLGNRALWHAARAADGRGPATLLTETVPRTLGCGDVAEAIEAIHFGRIPRASVTGLSPLLLEAAEQGDVPALGTVLRQAEEIATMASTLLRRLGLLSAVVPVVLGGGVLAGRSPVLERAIVRDLRASAPRAEPEWITAPPVLGAALAALSAAGAGPDALDRLAGAFAKIETARGTMSLARPEGFEPPTF